MQCNIDQRGARVRWWWGMANLLLAALLVAGALWWRNLIIGVVAIAAALSGGFALFEAHKRWCVLRAVGIKTKI